MREKVKVFFVDFWEDFNPYQNLFVDALQKYHEVEVSSLDPDIIFYSWLGDNHKYFKCTKIYYTPEDLAPQYVNCDYALTFKIWNDGKNLRYPHYLLYNYKAQDLIKTETELKNLIDKKIGFCSFVVSNPNSKKRIDFFNELSKYKKVDSGGRYLNNIGAPINSKQDFVSQYKFNIAFENCASEGYTTEKIVDAMIANTLPIYWGNPAINQEFNTKSFFNYNDYSSESDLIEDIIAHDKDPDKYYNKFVEPWFINNKPNDLFNEDRLPQFLKLVVDNLDKKTPISRNWVKQKIYYPLGKRAARVIQKLK